MRRSSIAELLLLAGQPEEALPHLHAMVALGPDQFFLHLRLADAYAFLGEEALGRGETRAETYLRRAAEGYAAALKLAPDVGEIRDELERVRELAQGGTDE